MRAVIIDVLRCLVMIGALFLIAAESRRIYLRVTGRSGGDVRRPVWAVRLSGFLSYLILLASAVVELSLHLGRPPTWRVGVYAVAVLLGLHSVFRTMDMTVVPKRLTRR